MSTRFPPVKTLEVAHACLCLHAQRAARTLARHFDEVFRRLDLTNGQFSLLMALNRPVPPTVGDLASFLAMDRTTLPALIKPLERRGLLAVSADAQDRRKRRVCLTTAGHRILQQAYPLWCEAHAALEGQISNAAGLRAHLVQLSTLAEASRAQGRASEA
jgi:DNA-binding MarR family transcriptional regulator